MVVVRSITADPLAEIGQREAVKRRFVRAFGIFANGLGLCEGQGIELQMFKISTNDR
jgi:hypothetical protein